MPGWTPEPATFTDAQGYRYRYKLAVQLAAPASVDIANAVPGKAFWTPPSLQLTLTISNLTAGRNAPVYGVLASAYWTTTVQQCAALGGTTSIALPNGKVFCPLASAAVGSDDPAARLAAGATNDYGGGPSAAGDPLPMSESDAAALTALTQQPPEGWMVTGHDFKENPTVQYVVPDFGSGPGYHSDVNIIAQKGMPKP